MRIGLPAVIGVISDTHGSVHPGAGDAFAGADLIIHAGDLGGPDVLVELEATAPTVAVRGNTDHGAWARSLPDSASVTVGDAVVWAVHDLHGARVPARAQVVVSGHTHVPAVEQVAGVLHVNPGSASVPRGGTARPTVAVLRVGSDGTLGARIVDL